MFDMLIVAVSICEQLITSFTAFSIRHLRFVSTLLTNERTSQPTNQAVIIEKPLKPVKKFPEFFCIP